jgi:hypothetical protein
LCQSLLFLAHRSVGLDCFQNADPPIAIAVDLAKLLVRAEKLATSQESVPIAVHCAEPMARL